MLCQSKELFLRAGTTSLFAALLFTSKKLKKRSMKLSFPPILTAARTLSNLFLALNVSKNILYGLYFLSI